MKNIRISLDIKLSTICEYNSIFLSFEIQGGKRSSSDSSSDIPGTCVHTQGLSSELALSHTGVQVRMSNALAML